MKKYKYANFPFCKYWFWFENPRDIAGADFVNFFSYEDCEVPGFKKKKGLTTRIDLRQGEQEVFSCIRKKFILEQAKKGKKNGITVSQDDTYDQFYAMYSQFRKLKGLSRESKSVLVKEGILFSAYYGQKLIAGGIFMSDGYYMRAHILASVRLESLAGKEREVVGQANRMVILSAIQFALQQKVSFFDLGGIDPDSQKQSDRSLAEFKEAFGGSRISFYFYTKCYSRFLIMLSNLKSKIRGI